MEVSDARAQSDLDFLRIRDQRLGAKAEEGERTFRYLLLKYQVDELRKELSAAHKKLVRQTDSLQEHMTRTHIAEQEVVVLRARLDATLATHEAEVDALRRSRSFRIGRAVLSPVRLVRRIFGR